jgi:hypothetical protein
LSKPLDANAARRLNALIVMLQEQALGDAHAAEAARRACEEFLTQEQVRDILGTHTDDQLASKGWTRQALTLAYHALAPKNSAAFGLCAATERHLNRLRARENSGDSGKEAAMGFVLPAPAAPQQGEPRRLKASEDDED